MKAKSSGHLGMFLQLSSSCDHFWMFFGFEKFRLFDALFATFTVKQNIKLANILAEITFLLIYLLPVYWRVRDMGGRGD